MGVSRAQALTLSMGAHLCLAALLALVPAPPLPPRAPSVTVSIELTPARSLAPPVLPMPGAQVVSVPAAADAPGQDPTHPRPAASQDAPGDRPGGGPAGLRVWTGRQDREDLRAQPWSASDAYRLLRVRTAGKTSSDESITQTARAALGATERRRAARVRRGDGAARGAQAPEVPVGPGQGAWPARGHAELASGSGTATQLLVDGTQAHAARAAAPVGPPATETAIDGPTREAVESSRASDQRHPDPFELTRAGGGVGDAATRARVPEGAPAALHAVDDDPYLRRLVARVTERVVFPPELALELEQGEVVVRFTLRQDGSVGDVSVSRPSGYSGFDRAVVVALGKAGPFGPVPEALRRGRAWVRVEAPFAFDNPVIR